MLSEAQQERYSRHLLLDGFDQEKLMAASVHVRGKTEAALWAARYLAASGVGRLCVDEPSWEPELAALNPWLQFGGECALAIEPQGGAVGGAEAALQAARKP